jgi:CheY-like chemotaxis protein
MRATLANSFRRLQGARFLYERRFMQMGESSVDRPLTETDALVIAASELEHAHDSELSTEERSLHTQAVRSWLGLARRLAAVSCGAAPSSPSDAVFDWRQDFVRQVEDRLAAVERELEMARLRDLTPRTVLVVDDEPLLAEATARLLGSEVRVRIAHTLAAARRALADELPDVLVCDYRMCGETSDELLAEVIIDYPRIRRVLYSGNPPERVRRMAHVVVEKPARAYVLQAAIRG